MSLNPPSAKALRERRAEIIHKAKELNARHADPATGALSADHQDDFDELVQQAEDLGKRIQSLDALEASLSSLDDVTRQPPSIDPMGRPGGKSGQPQPQFIDAATGKPIPVLDHNQAIADGDKRGPRVGEVIRAAVTGEGLASGMFASTIGGSDTQGGYLTTSETSKQILDLARSKSVALRNGARTVTMTGNELHMVRLTQDPVAFWRPEWGPVNSSSPGFDRITMRPKTLAAIVPMSIELAEDASNAVDAIEMALQSALGLALDQAVLFGAGSESEPQGITNTTGVNTVTSVGTPADYTDITSAVKSILTANYTGEVDSLVWLQHPRDAASYQALEDTTGQPLAPTPWAAALKKDHSTSFSVVEGGGSNESSMIIGDMSQVMVGMRTSGVRIDVFDSGQVNHSTGDTLNAMSQIGKFIRVFLRADVAVMRPSWLTVLSGVTTG